MDVSTPVAQWVTDLVYLGGNGIAWMVYLFVGVRLYRLSRRTGQLPEFLIAVSFLFWVLSYLFYDIPYALVESEALVPVVCSFASLLTLALGNVIFALFILSVFRRGARWAKWLVAAIAVSLVAGLAGTAQVGDWEGIIPLANPGYWLKYFGAFAPCVWIGAEGFAHYSRARRQLKLGLCEPMACNRFLLLGIAGTLLMILTAVSTANDFVNALTGRWSELLNFGIALFEVTPAVVIWFLFFPPAFYRRWVEGSAAAADTQPPTADEMALGAARDRSMPSRTDPS